MTLDVTDTQARHSGEAVPQGSNSLGSFVWGIYAVWRRHLRVYERTWLVNFLPPITEPLVYLLAFGYGLTPMVDHLIYQGQEITYTTFIGPGMIGLAILFQAFFEGSYGTFIRLYYQRSWQALLTAPLSYTQVYIGDLLWAATRGLISAGVTALVTVTLGFYSWTGLLVALPILVVGAILFAALGLVTAGLVETVDQINVPIFMLIVPMFVLCGTYFPRGNLPPFLKIVTDLLPLSSLVDLLRWPLGLPSTWPLAVLWLLGLTALASYLGWHQIRRKVFG